MSATLVSTIIVGLPKYNNNNKNKLETALMQKLHCFGWISSGRFLVAKIYSWTSGNFNFSGNRFECVHKTLYRKMCGQENGKEDGDKEVDRLKGFNITIRYCCFPFIQAWEDLQFGKVYYQMHPITFPSAGQKAIFSPPNSDEHSTHLHELCRNAFAKCYASQH